MISKITGLFVMGLALFSAIPVVAQEAGEKLVDEARCYACHQMTDTSIGPSWQAIAARHGSRSEVMKPVLAMKIIRGGGGNWGQVPMVAKQDLSEEEALQMVDWVLSQSPR